MIKKISAFFIILITTTLLSGQTIPSFKEAYLNEKRELTSEKKSLENLLSDLTERNRYHRKNLLNEITSLEQEVIEQKTRLESLLKENTVLKSRVDSFVENKNISISSINNFLMQTGKGNIKKYDDENPDIGTLLDKAINIIDKSGRIYVEEGSFFDINGKKKTGKIIKIGNITDIALSETSAGITRNNPDGSLSIVMESAPDQIKRVLTNGSGAIVPVFINQSSEHFEPAGKKSFIDTVNKGGIIAWIILFLGFTAMVFLTERFIYLKINSTDFNKISQLLLSGKIKEVDAEKMGSFGKVASMIHKNRNKERELLEEIAKEGILKEIPKLERFFAVSSVVAVTSPLLGLLGTVTGMISTFEVITVFGTGDPKMLSGGISEALITTEFGLAVAVPVLIVHTLLSRWSERISDNMERESLSLINKLKEK